MALRFIDSFDHYATADIARKYDLASSVGVNNSYGRHTGGAAYNTNNSYYTICKVFDAQSTWICGGAIMMTQASSNNLHPLFSFWDGGTLTDSQTTCQASVWVNEYGNFTVKRGNTIIAASSGKPSIPPSTWFFLEMKLVVHGSTGSVIVRVNGVTYISFSGNTQATGNATADRWAMYCNGGYSGTGWILDDLYICDGSGSHANNFLGDTKVSCLFPVSNGGQNDFTLSGAGSNYQAVDDATPNGDTDYVYSNTPDQIERYTYTQLAGSPTILGVQHFQTLRKDDVGTRIVHSLATIGATDYESADISVSDTYSGAASVYTDVPGTSNSWTVSDLNAAKFGIKLIS